MKTLVVEDDFTSRLFLETLLAEYGPCHVASNGLEAVRACRKALVAGKGYDLICLDIMMPEMDGQAALREIRSLEEAHGVAAESQARIIMTTALDDIKTVMEAFASLCDAYVCKPVDGEVLVEHLRKFHLI